MVEIPEIKDPTIEAMYRAIESGQDNGNRGYLGASLIGNECVRQIWYNYIGMPRKPFDAKTLLNFEAGHKAEDVAAERLRMVEGVELITHGKDGRQNGFKALGGKFCGHWDGIIKGLKQAPKTEHVWEHKDCNQKKYNEFQKCKRKFGEKACLRNWNKTYFAQAQLYMHYTGLNRHYMTVSLGGGREYESCRTEYEKEIAEFYIDRAEKIINATEAPPRISEKSDFFMCRWCDFKDECHNKKENEGGFDGWG